MLDSCVERLDAMIADAETLLACESPSSDLAAIARSADVVAEVVGARLAEAGLTAAPERLVVDGCTHLRWRFGGGRRVVVLTHHDTVWPLGSLATHAIGLHDGVLTGPGCFDMKVGLVQAVHAIAALAQAGGPAAVDGVTLLVTGDEEIGSPTSRGIIEAEARGARAVFVLEAAAPDGALKTARKGTSMYTVEAIGLAAHAGLEPEKGVNAAMEIAAQVPLIAALSSEEHGTTVTPTRLIADTTVNTVPAHARLDVDVRAMTAEEQRRVDKDMRGLQPTVHGSQLRVSGGISRPVMDRAHTAHLFARATALAPDAGIHPLLAVAVGGASDGNVTAGIGAPTLDGLGAVGGGAHADDEHVVIEHIPHRTALLALLIRDTLVGAGGRA